MHVPVPITRYAIAIGSNRPGRHGSEYIAPGGQTLLSSYHCSRYNQNTRKLDAAMFETVFARAIGIGRTGP